MPRIRAGSFGEVSARRCKLFEPASRSATHAPMRVLLHGGQQCANDFATGACMDKAAEAARVVVLYPEPSVSAHPLNASLDGVHLHQRLTALGRRTVVPRRLLTKEPV